MDSVRESKLSAFAIGFAEPVTAWIALRTFHSHRARGRRGPTRSGFTIPVDPSVIGTGDTTVDQHADCSDQPLI